SGTVEGEVLQDNCGLRLRRESHEALRDPVEPVADAVPFPSALAIEKPSGDPPIVGGLLARDLPSASVVDLLDAPHAFERHAEESCRIARCLNPIEGNLRSCPRRSSLEAHTASAPPSAGRR